MANKVQFNLKNVHYAKLTMSGSTPTYATPVAIPGAVSLSLAAQEETTKFYADGVVYFRNATNNGYEGDLEVAKFPESMLSDIWGDILTSTGKVYLEKNDVQAADFALLFQIDGDDAGECYCLYDCQATRPDLGSQTNEASLNPVTSKCTVSAIALPDGRVLAKTGSQTTTTVINGWFSAVYTATT